MYKLFSKKKPAIFYTCQQLLEANHGNDLFAIECSDSTVTIRLQLDPSYHFTIMPQANSGFAMTIQMKIAEKTYADFDNFQEKDLKEKVLEHLEATLNSYNKENGAGYSLQPQVGRTDSSALLLSK